MNPNLVPQSLEAEAALLGSLLLGFGDIPAVYDVVSGADFLRGDHRAIYKAVIDQYCIRREPADLVTLPALLRKQGELENIGGVEYLGKLCEEVPSEANALHYAALVAKQAYRRRLLRAVLDAQGRVNDQTIDESALAEFVETSIIAAARGFNRKGDIVRLGDSVEESLKEERDRAEGRLPPSLMTGFFDLDNLTAGTLPGEVFVIAAPPGDGKSSLMLNIIEHQATVDRIPVGIISLEMPPGQIGMRAVCANAAIDGRKVRSATLNDDERAKMQQWNAKLKGLPIWADTSGCPDIGNIRAQCRAMVNKHNVRAIFLDYLQLAELSGKQRSSVGSNERVGAASREIKRTALELKVAIYAMAQLNRADRKTNARPSLHSLRDSGEIEQDASMVGFIYTPKLEQPQNKIFILEKCRDGAKGDVAMSWDAKRTRFLEVGARDWRIPKATVVSVSPALSAPPLRRPAAAQAPMAADEFEVISD